MIITEIYLVSKQRNNKLIVTRVGVPRTYSVMIVSLISNLL